jgi:beta-glucosidase
MATNEGLVCDSSGVMCQRRSRRAALLAVASLAIAFALAPSSAAAAGLPHLPKRFLWGVSSSAFQSEGHTTGANWNHYIDRDDGSSPVGSPKEPYGNSVDFFGRYRGDIKRAAKLGVNTYRISINWTRVEPQPGRFSRKGLRFYDRVIETMRRHRIRPLITLNHWDYPMWVYDQGGWTNPKTVNDFLAMTKVIVRRYRAETTYWLTFNEEFFYEFIEQGNYPLDAAGVAAMRANLIHAHRRAYDLIHRLDHHAMVSSNYAWPGSGPLATIGTDPFMKAVADKLDYIGLDYYYPAYDQLATLISLSQGRSWEIPLDPFGIYSALRQMHAVFPGLPIVITENGVPTDNGAPRADDVTREQLLKDTLYWVQRARQDGVPVTGYLYWSLTDNYEWGSYRARFGLYTVNVQSDPKLVRHPTPAVKTFRNLIARRGVPAGYQLVYRPQASNCQLAAVAEADRAACLAAASP